MRLTLAILTLALTTSHAEARKGNRINPSREVIQVLEPDTRVVRTIAIFCSDNATQFDEHWCNRIARPFASNTDLRR